MAVAPQKAVRVHLWPKAKRKLATARICAGHGYKTGPLVGIKQLVCRELDALEALGLPRPRPAAGDSMSLGVRRGSK